MIKVRFLPAAEIELFKDLPTTPKLAPARAYAFRPQSTRQFLGVGVGVAVRVRSPGVKVSSPIYPQRSAGSSPVCLAILASIFGPISSPS